MGVSIVISRGAGNIMWVKEICGFMRFVCKGLQRCSTINKIAVIQRLISQIMANESSI